MTSVLRIHFVYLLQAMCSPVLMTLRAPTFCVCSFALNGSDQAAQTLNLDVNSLFNSGPRNRFF